jgi:PAS domain-containing protein
MARLTVAPSTQAMLRLVDGPALLSKHIQIGKYIVDAVIIDAHPEVARWYGYTSPTEMQGRYLSQLHDPHCLAQVRLYAVARKLGLSEVPEEYDIQIILPNGARRWLRKQQVRQISEGEDIYWISHSPRSSCHSPPSNSKATSAGAQSSTLKG